MQIILKKYNKFINNSAPVKIGKSTCNGKEFKRCRVTVTDKHFKEQLIKLGCVPNKSLILQFPEFLINDINLRYHFIRGYVDGDGCISFTKTGRLHLQIIGTYEFLNVIRLIFPELPPIRKDKRWKGNTYYISCACRTADAVLTKLYKDSNIYLQRKYDRFAVLLSN